MTNIRDATNTLLHYLYDSVNGLKKCAEQSSDSDLKNYLTNVAQKRQTYIDIIKGALPSNFDLTERGSIAGPFHRLFIDLKTMIEGNNSKAVKEEILRGDKTLITAYNEALIEVADVNLKATLSTQLQEIHHDLMEAVKA